MKTRDYFVIVRWKCDSERIETWTASDIQLFVKALREKRQDLFIQLENLLLSDAAKKQKYSVCVDRETAFARESLEETWNIGKNSNVQGLSFECKLESWQFERIAEVANAEGIFAYPSSVTGKIMEAFFFLRGVELRVRNLRLFCVLMSALSNYDFIKRYWQAPIYKGRLLRAYEKDGYVNRSDLTTANNAINSMYMDKRVERIMKVVKGLKEQRC